MSSSCQSDHVLYKDVTKLIFVSSASATYWVMGTTFCPSGRHPRTMDDIKDFHDMVTLEEGRRVLRGPVSLVYTRSTFCRFQVFSSIHDPLQADEDAARKEFPDPINPDREHQPPIDSMMTQLFETACGPIILVAKIMSEGTTLRRISIANTHPSHQFSHEVRVSRYGISVVNCDCESWSYWETSVQQSVMQYRRQIAPERKHKDVTDKTYSGNTEQETSPSTSSTHTMRQTHEPMTMGVDSSLLFYCHVSSKSHRSAKPGAGCISASIHHQTRAHQVPQCEHFGYCARLRFPNRWHVFQTLSVTCYFDHIVQVFLVPILSLHVAVASSFVVCEKGIPQSADRDDKMIVVDKSYPWQICPEACRIDPHYGLLTRSTPRTRSVEKARVTRQKSQSPLTKRQFTPTSDRHFRMAVKRVSRNEGTLQDKEQLSEEQDLPLSAPFHSQVSQKKHRCSQDDTCSSVHPWKNGPSGSPRWRVTPHALKEEDVTLRNQLQVQDNRKLRDDHKNRPCNKKQTTSWASWSWRPTSQKRFRSLRRSDIICWSVFHTEGK